MKGASGSPRCNGNFSFLTPGQYRFWRLLHHRQHICGKMSSRIHPFFDGKFNSKISTTPFAGIQRQGTVMIGDNSLGDVQPDSLPVLFGGKKGIKYLVPQSAGNTRAGVGNTNANRIVSGIRFYPDCFGALAVFHGIGCIVYQIQQLHCEHLNIVFLL